MFTTVQGYKEVHKPNDEEALNKLFERDKDALRASGVQILSYIPKEEMEDNQEFRYRIPNESFIWPKDFKKLDGRQIALLNLAAQVWAQASLSADAEIAMTRLRALGEVPEDSGLVGIAPRIRTHHRSFRPLNDAISNQDVVSFDYRKAGSGNVETRTVEPWALQNVGGQWLLVCLDRDKQQPRNFLLKRIVSLKITKTGDKFERPSKQVLEAAQDELAQLIEQNVATIRVQKDSDAWFHFEMDLPRENQNGELSLNFMDINLLADELREYAMDIEVLRPAELKEAIRAGFEKVASDHHD
ncbi:MAG: helix-turn-helix transcriptional regulator [Micrococcales bacterium]